jgi:hypothetical protein
MSGLSNEDKPSVTSKRLRRDPARLHAAPTCRGRRGGRLVPQFSCDPARPGRRRRRPAGSAVAAGCRQPTTSWIAEDAAARELPRSSVAATLHYVTSPAPDSTCRHGQSRSPRLHARGWPGGRLRRSCKLFSHKPLPYSATLLCQHRSDSRSGRRWICTTMPRRVCLPDVAWRNEEPLDVSRSYRPPGPPEER